MNPNHIRQRFRGDGTTTKQIEACPFESVYIVQHYAEAGRVKDMAVGMGRSDLKVHTLADLEAHIFAGIRPSAIVLDHSCSLTEKQWIYLQRLIAMCRTDIHP